LAIEPIREVLRDMRTAVLVSIPFTIVPICVPIWVYLISDIDTGSRDFHVGAATGIAMAWCYMTVIRQFFGFRGFKRRDKA
jgi:hypothetical protein